MRAHTKNANTNVLWLLIIMLMPKKVSDILNYKMKFDIEMLNYNYIMHFSTAYILASVL